MPTVRRAIEDLFNRLASEVDGEFGQWEDRRPYSVIAPRVAAGRLLFTTKNCIALYAIVDQPNSESLGTFCRYGLPHERDLDWIRPLAAQHELNFLGDLDPIDLLVFAWLRDGLAPQPIRHFGINDEYLAKLGTELPANYFLNCSPSEQLALPTLTELLPDLEQLVGPNCKRTILSGSKLELEAIVSSLGGLRRIPVPCGE